MTRLVALKTAAAAAGLAIASLALAQNAPSGRDAAPAAPNQPKPVMMLVPIEVSSPAMEAGCWAQLFDKRNFQGEALTIAGPMEVDSVDKYAGRALKRNIDSLMTGPRARMTVFEHRLFKDRQVEFGPNSKQVGVVRELGFGGSIQSLRLECV